MDILQNYASSKHLCDNKLWTIKKSTLGGHGLFAIEDIPPGTTLFKEPSLLAGPRTDSRCPPVCISCSKLSPNLRQCSKGCLMLVCCADCEISSGHLECSIMRKVAGVDPRIRLSMIVPLRTIFLSTKDRLVLQCLEKHAKPEQEILLKPLKPLLSNDELDIVRICCQVIDATAFELKTDGRGSLRAIYPIAAMMNHNCTPNTRYIYDDQGRIVVKTTKLISAGQEITNTYTCLTWGTQTRRAHLQVTKNFLCQCERCLDPTEFGARLMGLYCMKKGCGGVLLPVGPDFGKDPWNCTVCQTSVPASRIAVIQKMVASTIQKVNDSDPTSAYRILCKNTLVPAGNHHAVEFKLNLVRRFGYEIRWEDLSKEELSLKLLLCKQLILLMDVLNLGLCSQKEFLQSELTITTNELQKRNT